MTAAVNISPIKFPTRLKWLAYNLNTKVDIRVGNELTRPGATTLFIFFFSEAQSTQE